MSIPSNVSFNGNHSSVGEYTVFLFDPMHVLSPGVSKPLKECHVTVIGDADRNMLAVETKFGSNKTYESIKCVVIQCLNGFSEKCF